ncbi:akirin-1B-like [Electrophorus electricus]|uniref:Akirin 1 n=2 Tax=Electrophorus TaxID=8004 RepID=A0A4W4F295_ELEEL|nr:akirin-1B-like [Electrophorus electricus]
MACGATLKRSMEFEALHGPQSPKRRRCHMLPGSSGAPAPQRCHLRPTETQPPAGEHRLSPEQIFQNIREEYSRYQRRCQTEGGVAPSDERSTSPALSSAPSSPTGVCVKRDQPSFTMQQVSCLCERLLREFDEALREEYDRVLNSKLAEQYESFVKFTQDQIARRYGARPASYVS